MQPVNSTTISPLVAAMVKLSIEPKTKATFDAPLLIEQFASTYKDANDIVGAVRVDLVDIFGAIAPTLCVKGLEEETALIDHVAHLIVGKEESTSTYYAKNRAAIQLITPHIKPLLQKLKRDTPNYLQGLVMQHERDLEYHDKLHRILLVKRSSRQTFSLIQSLSAIQKQSATFDGKAALFDLFYSRVQGLYVPSTPITATTTKSLAFQVTAKPVVVASN